MCRTLPLVSIIIPSQRQHYIEELILSFTPSVTGTITYELIVIADYTVTELKKKYHHVQWIFDTTKNIAKKRNIGIHVSTADTIAFIDDDCLPLENWVSNGYNAMQHNHQLCGLEGSTRIEIKMNHIGIPRDYYRLEQPGFRTNNIFYKKHILVTHGSFDERFSQQHEDADLAFTLMDAGYIIGYDKTVQVIHRQRTHEPWDLLKSCWRRRFDPLLCAKHPILYKKHRKSAIPKTIKGIALFDGMLITLFLMKKCVFLFSCLLIAICGFAALKRNTHTNGCIQLVIDTLSYFLSPVVLSVALLVGKIRSHCF